MSHRSSLTNMDAASLPACFVTNQRNVIEPTLEIYLKYTTKSLYGRKNILKNIDNCNPELLSNLLLSKKS